MDLQLKTGVNFDWWKDNRGNSASQTSIPVSVYGNHQDFSIRFLTAYTRTDLTTGTGGAGLGDFLDAKLGVRYMMAGTLPVDILVGLDFNLPTGKTNLSRSQTSLIMDSDLVSVNSFGEGFNVNPTITVAKEWQNWVVAAGFGYLWRGSYDFSADLGITEYQPGANYTTTAEIRFYPTPESYLRTFATHTRYATDTVMGKDFARQGNATIAGLSAYYGQQKSWNADIGFKYIVRAKAESESAVGILARDTANAQGDEYIIDLASRFILDSSTTLAIPIQYRFVAKNGYDEMSANFVGEREKVSLGVTLHRSLTRNVLVEAGIKGFYRHEDKIANAVSFQNSRDYTGMSVTGAVTGSF
jgi:hypothetical protein